MRVPGFAGEFAAPVRHQPVVVMHLVLDPEGAGIHQDRLQLVVQAGSSEQQQARLRRDRRPDLVRDLEAVAADELLLAQERDHESFEAVRERRRQ